MSTTTTHDEEKAVLAFSSLDPEARLALPLGRNTNPSAFNTLLLGVILCGAFYSIAYLIIFVFGAASTIAHQNDLDHASGAVDVGFNDSQVADESAAVGDGEHPTVSDTIAGASSVPTAWRYLTGFNNIPIYIAFFSFWSLAILLLKALKIRAQRRALTTRILPDDPGFVLTRGTVDRVLENVEQTILGAERFVLVYRVLAGLRSVRNTGRIAETDSVIESLADADDSIMESGYTLVRGFIWAIPVLGFIGTIMGLTSAIGGFQKVLSRGEGTPFDASELTEKLGVVISGLEEAFITTGEALICALVIQILLTFVRTSDESFLDDCRQYTARFVLPRLRVDPSESH